MLDRQNAEASQGALLRRVAAQDSGALAELYDQLAGVLFSTAIHMLGDRREAEEVVQDVFLQVWTKAGTFDDSLGTPFHWVLGITRNRCIDYLRARQRRSRLFDEGSARDRLESDLPSSTPPQSLGSEELAAIHAAVHSLPQDQQQAIAMAFFGGMTHQEIATALKEPLGTIKARIRRGMLKLRDALKAYL